jgi:nitric oxide dioxygenase
MVSAEAKPYIDASVPVLREHGLTITRTFYENMFNEHPELTNLFNMGNQASGVQQQSLASAVFAYAANIDNAGALGPVVNRIVHKHVSVGIKAEHYPIVGRHLLGAIQQTLGDAATPPLLSAWEEAYSALAGALIDAERNLYAQANIKPGQLHDMRVLETRHEAEGILSIVMQPLDGQPAPQFKPGQYISVCVNFGNGRRQLRQYSLSDAPKSDRLRISIKREVPGDETPAGEVSNWLHDNVKRDSILQITHPFGEFTPDTESVKPIVLLAAGVGITPMVSALKRIAQINPQRRVIFAFAGRDQSHHAHQADIAYAQSVMPNLQVFNFYESLDGTDATQADVHEGLMDVRKLPAWPKAEANVYMCGPTGFMKTQWLSLIEGGVPAANLHREVFGPELLDYLM